MKQSDPPHVLFFVGHFNDIDHIAPVAYKLEASGRGRPVMLVTDPLYDIAADYRLRFLRERHGVPVVRVFSFHPLLRVTGWIVRLLSSPLGRGLLRWRRRFLLRAIRKVFYNKRWARRALDRYRPAALVFEWAYAAGGLEGAFLDSGHERGIPSISLPHGMLIYTNELITREEREHGRSSRWHVNLFDRTVYQSRLHAKRDVEDGASAGKVAVLGSARYCDEWRRINQEIQPERFAPRKGEGCTYRAVFMLPQWDYNADFEATIEALHRLGKERWLHLVLKPTTREIEERPRYLRELEEYPNVEIEGRTGSVELIRWADAVIVPASSIALEALLQGKPLVYPKYLHENTTVFEEAGANWRVNGDDELVAALRALAGGGSPPYGEAEVAKVVRVLVQGGSEETDILTRYADFLLGGWRASEVAQTPARAKR